MKRKATLVNLSKRLACLFLALIGLITYLNSFANYFVWDDEILIVGNGYIKSFSNLFKIFTVDIFHWITNSNFYRPLFSLSLMFDYRLWQLNPFGYHLTNLILHLLNTFLVFYLINFLSLNLKASLIGSLFYLVHPVHTQAVTYISGRADLLAGFFILSALLLFARVNKTKAGSKNVFYFLSALFFIFGLLAKEIALVLPLLLILYDYCFGDKLKNFKKHIPFLSLACIYILLRNKFLPFQSEGMLPLSLSTRIINFPKVIVFYLFLLLSPGNLRIDRSFSLSRPLDLSVIFCILLLIAILLWIVKYRYNKVLLFSSLWFFILLLPVTNIILPLNAVVADHWLYLPSIGFFIILALGMDKLLGKDFFITGLKISYQFKMTIIVVIITTLSLLTITRNFEWRDPVILFEATLKSAHKNADHWDIRVHANLANAYLEKGLYNQAILEFQEALKGFPFPQCKRVHYQLAFVYFAQSLYQKAEEELLKAIEADPDYVSAYYMLGRLYKKMGKIDKAQATWEKMLKAKPSHPQEQAILENFRRRPLYNSLTNNQFYNNIE